jgi:hypothetical protein
VTGPAPDAPIGRGGDDGAVSTTPATGLAGADRAPLVGGVPADPVAYDSERNAAARKRGLSTPYIPGGRDPDQAAADREDRRYLKILLVVVISVILGGFVLGMIAALLGFDSLVGIPT